jgi:hypothetical protein
MKYKIAIARFPYGGSERKEVSRWLPTLCKQIRSYSSIDQIISLEYDDTPITMTRNKSFMDAKNAECDFLLMIDSDMHPDKYVGVDPSAKPFFPTAFEFMVKHQGPCVIAAPYCGPPPHENVYVFQWGRKQGDYPGCDMSLDQYSREHAAICSGIQEAAALPTGLMLIDMRILPMIPPPWFEYEYADPPYNTKKATTEDVFITRNMALVGIKQYCAWDCWAGHMKWKSVGRPEVYTTDMVRKDLREAVIKGNTMTERLIEVFGEEVGR